MNRTHLMLAVSLLSMAVAPTTALAQDDGYDDLDDPDEAGAKKSKERKERKRPEVREIVKGAYAKSSVGAAAYLGQFSGFVSSGTATGLTLGYDFVDQEKTSAAAELMLFQGIHNGCHYEYQVTGECPGAPGEPGPLIQGDLRTYTIGAAVEWSFYPARRVGIGLRAGGGILLSPLLMDEEAYERDVVLGSWGGQKPAYHESPHPMFLGGPTFEYYTKLSHFSVGIDADIFYAVGFDLGLNATGNLKYTF